MVKTVTVENIPWCGNPSKVTPRVCRRPKVTSNPKYPRETFEAKTPSNQKEHNVFPKTFRKKLHGLMRRRENFFAIAAGVKQTAFEEIKKTPPC